MQSYKASLKESIKKLEDARRVRILTLAEQDALDKLYDELDRHQTYLNESGQAYEF